ncbi:MAG TPA: hypothetical protein VG365_11405 [Solirubrobacteraceae bacterium]|nr:hypothetical protein [Solirubrobacteraceae bacterium]
MAQLAPEIPDGSFSFLHGTAPKPVQRDRNVVCSPVGVAEGGPIDWRRI